MTFETTLAVSNPVAAMFHAIFLADRPFLPPWGPPSTAVATNVKIILRKSSRLGGTRDGEKSWSCTALKPGPVSFVLAKPTRPSRQLRSYVSLFSYRSDLLLFSPPSLSLFSFLPFLEKIVAPSATTGEILAAPGELKDLLNHHSSTVFRPVLLIVQPACLLFSTPPSATLPPHHPCFALFSLHDREITSTELIITTLLRRNSCTGILFDGLWPRLVSSTLLSKVQRRGLSSRFISRRNLQLDLIRVCLCLRIS